MPIRFEEYRPEHLPRIRQLYSEWPEYWGGLENMPSPWDDFRSWWEWESNGCLVAYDDVAMVAFAYVSDIRVGNWAVIHVVKKRGYLNPELFTKVANEGLPWFFKKYGIHKLIGYVREDHDSCIRLYTSLGFHEDGRLREHEETDDGRLDLIVVSLLEREVGNVSV
jgi:RimJ/RimL family protein N-acetyltransferase|tara:strand:- start:7690 stop:8187 length:498 start_codon:yes stop_codon:yes gene_type:complete